MKIFITSDSEIGLKCYNWALKKNLPITSDINEADIIFSVFHKEIFSEDFILSKKFIFNFHAGILPFYRGSCTLNWAILNDEKYTGITLHLIDKNIDSGPIIKIEKIEILPKDTAESLYKKCEIVVFSIFQAEISNLIMGNFTAKKQNNAHARLYRKSDLLKIMDLTKFARAFHFSGKEQAFYFDSDNNKNYLRFK